MATKFVLQSGGVSNHPAKRAVFHKELVAGMEGKVRFLLCAFAQGRELWEGRFPDYQDGIAGDMPDEIQPEFELAMPEKFAEQCRAADVIYMHGGDDHLVQYWRKQFDLTTLFDQKVVSVNSASSNALATASWTCDWRAVIDGLGVLPIKFIPHYKSDWGEDDPRGPIDWEAAYQDLKSYGDDLPIHALEEGDFVVIEQ